MSIESGTLHLRIDPWLKQHDDVGAAELEVAELLAFEQLRSGDCSQVDRPDVGHTDRMTATTPT